MTIRTIAAIGALVAASTVSAQQYKSLVSVATFKVAPGGESAFVEKGKAFAPVLDKLMDAGVVLAYGMDTSMLHVPGENNVDFWVVVPNYGALEKSDAAIDEFMGQHPALMQEVASLTDLSAHRDMLIQTMEQNYTKVPAGSKPIMAFETMRAKPGRMGDFIALFNKYHKPVFDKLVADGVIYGYELDSEALDTMEPGTIWGLVIMPDLAAEDKLEAAFSAAMKNLPEADRNTMEKQLMDTIEYATHRDRITRAVVFRTK